MEIKFINAVALSISSIFGILFGILFIVFAFYKKSVIFLIIAFILILIGLITTSFVLSEK